MTDETQGETPSAKPSIFDFEREAGLLHLSPLWEKVEIVLGLTAAAAGLKLLLVDGVMSVAGGTLMVLGAYLAMAGNRSHLYQSQNRQTTYLRSLILDSRPADSSGR